MARTALEKESLLTKLIEVAAPDLLNWRHESAAATRFARNQAPERKVSPG
jgi:hypothetical protein